MAFSDHFLLAEYEGTTYRVGKLTIEKDGSLYVFLPRRGATGKGVRYDRSGDIIEYERAASAIKKISYHTSGQVHADFYREMVSYFDPLTRLAETNWFCGYYVPKINALDVHGKEATVRDHVLRARTSKSLFLQFGAAPLDLDAPKDAICFVSYFQLLIHFSTECPPDARPPHEDMFVTFIPQEGKHSSPILQKDQAFIEFHRKSAGSPEDEGILLIGPSEDSKDGVYRAIPKVPMARPITVAIDFAESGLWAETLSLNDKTGHICARFRICDKHGVRQDLVAMRSIALSAEL